MRKKILPSDIEELDELPPPSKKYLQIVRPAPGKPFIGICLSAKLLILKTHYWNDRTTGCVAPKKPCDACDSGRKRRIHGYFAAVERAGKRAVLVQLTDECMRAAKWLKERQGKLRGIQFRLERCGPSMQSRTRITIDSERMVNPEQLGPEIPIKQALTDIWNADGKSDADEELLQKVQSILEATGKENRPLLENPD